MSHLRIAGVAAVLAAALAGYSATTAKADVATRCDWRGCSHIACNWTGDRCHRFYGDGYYRNGYRDGYYRDRDDGYYRDSYYRDNGYDGRRYRYDDADYRNGRDRGWRYDCDRDADNCYVRRSWND